MSNISFKIFDVNLPFLKYFGVKKPLYSDAYIYEANQIVIGNIVSINAENDRYIAELNVTESLKGKNLETVKFLASNSWNSFRQDVRVLQKGLFFFTESLIQNEYEMIFFHELEGNETTDRYTEFVKSKI